MGKINQRTWLNMEDNSNGKKNLYPLPHIQSVPKLWTPESISLRSTIFPTFSFPTDICFLPLYHSLMSEPETWAYCANSPSQKSPKLFPPLLPPGNFIFTLKCYISYSRTFDSLSIFNLLQTHSLLSEAQRFLLRILEEKEWEDIWNASHLVSFFL